MSVARDFYLRLLVKTLFCVLVRPIFEYRAVVWDPHTVDYSLQIKRIQHWFMRFSNNLLNIPCDPREFAPVSKVLNFISLADRWCSMSIFYLKGLLENKVDLFCPCCIDKFQGPTENY